jgi:hypothetical protein
MQLLTIERSNSHGDICFLHRPLCGSFQFTILAKRDMMFSAHMYVKILFIQPGVDGREKRERERE